MATASIERRLPCLKTSDLGLQGCDDAPERRGVAVNADDECWKPPKRRGLTKVRMLAGPSIRTLPWGRTLYLAKAGPDGFASVGNTPLRVCRLHSCTFDYACFRVLR